jgi:malate permease and related proteins
MELSTTILTLLSYMLVGVLCKKSDILNDTVNKGISNILVSVVLPCSSIISLQMEYSKQKLINIVTIFTLALFSFFLSSIIGYVSCKFAKIEQDKKSIWIFAATFPNTIFIGIPIVQTLFGNESLYLLFVVGAAFNFIVFTFGISLMKKSTGGSKMKPLDLLKNNVILSVLVGIILFLLRVSLPTFINDTLTGIGNTVTPLAMILLGSMLAKNTNLSLITDVKAYLICLIRLIVVPFIAILSLSFLNNKTIASILIISLATPIAALTAVLSEKYNNNTEFASKVVFLSTLMSMFTLPIVSMLIKKNYGV